MLLFSSPFPRKLTPDIESRLNIVSCITKGWILGCLNSHHPLGQDKRKKGFSRCCCGFCIPGDGAGFGCRGCCSPSAAHEHRANTAGSHLALALLCSAICPAARQGQEGVWQRGDPSCPPAAARGYPLQQQQVCLHVFMYSKSAMKTLFILSLLAGNLMWVCRSLCVACFRSLAVRCLDSAGVGLRMLLYPDPRSASELLLCICGRSREPWCPHQPSPAPSRMCQVG